MCVKLNVVRELKVVSVNVSKKPEHETEISEGQLEKGSGGSVLVSQLERACWV